MVVVISQELGHWKLSHTTYSFLAMQAVLIFLPMLAFYKGIYILQWISYGNYLILKHLGHHCNTMFLFY